MIPYKDDNPSHSIPFITIGLIIANTIIFFVQITSGADPRQVVLAYGAIPHFLLTFKTVQPIHPILTVFTSMFMHGGLFHLFGNMFYLWIFGDNIEDRLGHIRFLVFYLLCGVVAAYAHAITEHSSLLPMVGASGAVSGVLGAYLLLFPHARIRTLIFFGFFVQIVRLPALILIGFWIIVQFINAMLSKAVVGHGGVAWFAHIGGFVFGLLAVKFFMKSRRRV